MRSAGRVPGSASRLKQPATPERNGYDAASNLRYIERDQNLAENRLIVTVVMAMGLPIVAIGMIGLLSAMASNILDRTREIGILRSIGARRRDLRAMFRTRSGRSRSHSSSH